MVLSATTALTTADNVTIYAKFTYAQGDTCQFTSKDGYLYYVNVANKLYRKASQPDLASGVQYGTATYSSVEYYHDAACENALTSGEKALIAAGSLTVRISAGARARVALHAPTAVGADFYADDGTGEHHGFGASLANSVDQTATIAAGGAVTGLGTVYYAVNGSGATLLDTSGLSSYIGTDVSNVGGVNWNDGTSASITQNLTVHVQA